MTAATRAVFERLVDSLQVVNNFLKLAENNLGVEPSGDYDAPLIAEARALLEEPASEDAAKEGFVLVPVEPLKTLIQDYVRATSPEYLMPPPWLIQVRASIKKTKESGK